MCIGVCILTITLKVLCSNITLGFSQLCSSVHSSRGVLHFTFVQEIWSCSCSVNHYSLVHMNRVVVPFPVMEVFTHVWCLCSWIELIASCIPLYCKPKFIFTQIYLGGSQSFSWLLMGVGGGGGEAV